VLNFFIIFYCIGLLGEQHLRSCVYLDESWRDPLHFGAESGQVHLMHLNFLVLNFASAFLLVKMVQVDSLACGAVFARINHVLHLLVSLFQVCD